MTVLFQSFVLTACGGQHDDQQTTPHTSRFCPPPNSLLSANVTLEIRRHVSCLLCFSPLVSCLVSVPFHLTMLRVCAQLSSVFPETKRISDHKNLTFNVYDFSLGLPDHLLSRSRMVESLFKRLTPQENLSDNRTFADFAQSGALWLKIGQIMLAADWQAKQSSTWDGWILGVQRSKNSASMSCYRKDLFSL